MVKSMTSFGRASSRQESKHLFSVEMKSVNHRYLDVNVKMPKSMLSLEEQIRKLINKSLSRGKVDVFINLKGNSEGNGVAKVNLDLAKSYLKCLMDIEESLGVRNDITINQIARYPEVIKVMEEEDSIEEIFKEIKPLIEESILMMEEMRKVEGEKLKEDILLKLSEIENLVEEISKIAEKVPMAYKIKLEERLKKLLDGIEIDESRIALEIAIIADKASVDEEITRLHSHIHQLRKTFEEDETIGRKLDFIIQEMNREANTIASKSSDVYMTNIVINIKNLIEKMREQVQNIE
ncbi:YicC/YloC family endoribonuclease [Clostridium gasigenes]|uniref:YicC/YloC family endoribonuclease n=1 Tax=Clostridium gasigenes TaxID=94869 RepID=UPI0014383C56|nr:YicC/YloC family endoribonuclease [Clostridium gasigenes]MBU3104102.1 YicC family protein [Clostridium gasigenes]MBU3107230.1 YicC family protein [Clostridium gasigenes]MBU3132496.1 YicC family protein [Clostridium gasigenes]MBU3135626.1 YicC family protein [Clostridium gasigenes]NKF05985.1 YicC family protein [Clostridium gasigenes]